MSKKTILFLEGQNNGCNWYRLRQPYLKLQERDSFICASNKDLSGDDLEAWLQNADVVVSQCVSGEKYLEFMMERKGKTKFVIDLDDNFFAVDPLNPSYAQHGTREVDIALPDGGKIQIRDGQNGFNIDENRKRLKLAAACLQQADLVTTTSSVLAGYLKRFNQKVKIIRNLVDFRAWYPLDIHYADQAIRIGWQGGWSHYRDFFEVKEALEAVLKKYPRTKLVVMGQFFSGVFKELPANRVEHHTWTTVEAYPWKFKTLGVDIGIAPIAKTEFNQCKSEVKWEEYGSLGIPTVASNIPPYNLAIRDGETGYLCDSRAEWEENLSRLVEDEVLRRKIGAQALDEIRKKYDLDSQIEAYEETYRSLFRREIILA